VCPSLHIPCLHTPQRARTLRKMAFYLALSHRFRRGRRRLGHPTLRRISVPACSPFAYSPVRQRLCAVISHIYHGTTTVGRGLTLAPGVQVPEVIQKALNSSPATRRSISNRDSLHRKRNWWLPYIVLEFDNNQVLVDAMGGDLANPVWNYRTVL